MMQSTNYRSGRASAVASLLAGAAVWGLVWYPYRLLEARGLSGVSASLFSYLFAFLLALLLFHRRLRGGRIDGWLLAIAISAGACNLGYVLATLHGQVMRVLLLFYLAPLWTVLFARMLLGERPGRTGMAVVALAVSGAAVMLWRPELGAPWPDNAAEWQGLASGLLFALSNVLIRRADHHSVEFKSAAVFVGVAVLTAPQAFAEDTLHVLASAETATGLAIIGVLLVAANFLVQYGLSRVAAGRAIVILTFELPVAALASWLLAGEAMGPAEWAGGALIVLAGLVAARLEV